MITTEVSACTDYLGLGTIISMENMQKLIGTLVPMSALFSSKSHENDKGTFVAGLIFLDWLKETHQSAWQLLPLYTTQLEPGSSTKYIPSPYKSYGIGLDPKYLPVTSASIFPTEQEKKNFISVNSEWISDYALFCALRDYFQTDDWRNWDRDLRSRKAKALTLWTDKLSEKIDNHIIVQWQLHQSYTILRNKAKKLGIVLIGDLPFYLSVQSPLVWTYQDAFQIEKDGTMRYVSGVLDGSSSRFGRQVWGHPLYDWEENRKETIVAIWKIRLRYMAKLFDYIRFDYARGFFQYDAMDVVNKYNDTYKKGPGASVFEELVQFNRRNGVASFAEDCGRNLKQLRQSMQKIKIPGVKIFFYALDEKRRKINKEYADITHYPVNTVAYTTIHDTETLFGYLRNLTREQKQMLAEASHVIYNLDNKVFTKRLRDAIIMSPAHTVIIPIQDWLLTTDRINVPGTELPINDPNWHFCMKIPIENLPTLL